MALATAVTITIAYILELSSKVHVTPVPPPKLGLALAPGLRTPPRRHELHSHVDAPRGAQTHTLSPLLAAVLVAVAVAAVASSDTAERGGEILLVFTAPCCPAAT